LMNNEYPRLPSFGGQRLTIFEPIAIGFRSALNHHSKIVNPCSKFRTI
jgi:hypothetical protein